MIEQVFGNENFKLMSLIIREKNTPEELEYIKQSEERIRSKEFYDVAVEHELVSTIGAKLVKKVGLELGDPWKKEMDETRARLGFLFAKVEQLGEDLKANGNTAILQQD